MTPRRCTSDVIDGSFAATFNTSETQVYAEDCRLCRLCAGWDYPSPLRLVGPDEDGRAQDAGLSSVSQLCRKFFACFALDSRAARLI